ncbi:MAG: hypothetical protein K2W85_15145 [Phycisphaerales bacterium]|nr:hypothetical protein [Phycisphaerales bacterium]
MAMMPPKEKNPIWRLTAAQMREGQDYEDVLHASTFVNMKIMQRKTLLS